MTALAASGPAIPWPGLLEALASYSGKGQLYRAVAASDARDPWTPADTRRRARRVLLSEALPALAGWPAAPGAWWDALPAAVRATRALSPVPTGKVDWPRTRTAGWPPAGGFRTRVRHRTQDETLVRVLTWTLARLRQVRADACRLAPGLDRPVAAQLDAADRVLGLLGAPPDDDPPDRTALAAAAHGGRPWGAVAEVARLLLTEDRDLETVARRLLLPDPAARGRLFHLACLGLVLRTAREAGAVVTGLRPLGAGPGPAYAVTDALGRRWDLWFEAAGTWTWYGRDSPYRQATRGLPGASQPIGADLALVRPGRHALVVECKYSDDPTYVTRDGYEQALAYQAEALSGLVRTARAVVVGPDDVLSASGTTRTVLGPVHLLPASDLPAAVRVTLAR